LREERLRIALGPIGLTLIVIVSLRFLCFGEVKDLPGGPCRIFARLDL
jgi:hypothetical protein